MSDFTAVSTRRPVLTFIKITITQIIRMIDLLSFRTLATNRFVTLIAKVLPEFRFNFRIKWVALFEFTEIV